MSWHPSIPNEVNVVRGASGDLLFIRENFDLLSGVATRGISGLMNASGTGAPVSGDVVSWHSTASGWLTSGIRLDTNLRDVLVPTATSGQALTYSGTFPSGKWIASTPVQTISGLTDVQMNPPTPLSGQALVYSGTHPTGKWTPSGIQITSLDSIGDVSAPSPASGEFLIWNGSAWVASGGVVPRRAALVVTGTLTITGGDPMKVLLDQEAFVTSGFTTNTASGEIIVGSGISHVNVKSLSKFLSSGAAQGDHYGAEIRKNGLALSGISGYGLQVSGVARQAAAEHTSLYLEAPTVPVSGGDIFSLWVHKSGAVADRVMAQTMTWLHVEDCSTPGGGGGAGAGFADPVSGVYHPDLPPQTASGHEMDHQFDGFTTLSDALPSPWALADPAAVGSTASGDRRYGSIRLRTTAAASFWTSVYRPISGFGTPISGQDWTVYAKVTALYGSNHDLNFGLAVFEDAAVSGSNFVSVNVRNSLTTDTTMDTKEYAHVGDLAGTGGAAFPGGLGRITPTTWYFRLTHTAANGFRGAFSSDGIGWVDMATTITPTWNPQHVGIVAARRTGGGTADVHALLFRAVSGSSSATAPMPMGIEKLERVGTVSFG